EEPQEEEPQEEEPQEEEPQEEEPQEEPLEEPYTASGNITLKAVKSMKSEDTVLGTFLFELKDEAGSVIETAANDANGVISFAAIYYDQEDIGKTFTYTVNEKIPGTADTYVYDSTVYTVKVTVSDNGDGTLGTAAIVSKAADSTSDTISGTAYTDTVIAFVNDVTLATITKTDATTGAALAGATLRVIDADGNKIDEWISDGSAHVITGKLVAGETYRLIEVSAPEDYRVADAITFTVGTDGTAAVEMKDPKNEVAKEEQISVSVTKDLVLDDDSRIGAEDATFYVTLYSDADYTTRVADIVALNYVYMDSVTVTFTGLQAGMTYYAAECDENGDMIDSFKVGDGILCYADFEAGHEILVTETGGYTALSFVNRFYDLPTGYYIEPEEPSVDQETEYTEESEEMSETESEIETEKEMETSSVQTGDEIPIAPYLVLMLAALAVLLISGGYRRRERR
ncbi:MAG: hypothetical protein LUI14_03795, partial [Lachnospiraceae bacterium]|nr:hypothetical protein [Lachnospiraceae bacterium]